jgi:hypothetical protein
MSTFHKVFQASDSLHILKRWKSLVHFREWMDPLQGQKTNQQAVPGFSEVYKQGTY